MLWERYFGSIEKIVFTTFEVSARILHQKLIHLHCNKCNASAVYYYYKSICEILKWLFVCMCVYVCSWERFYNTLCRIIIKSLHCTNSIIVFEMYNANGILVGFVVHHSHCQTKIYTSTAFGMTQRCYSPHTRARMYYSYAIAYAFSLCQSKNLSLTTSMHATVHTALRWMHSKLWRKFPFALSKWRKLQVPTKNKSLLLVNSVELSCHCIYARP